MPTLREVRSRINGVRKTQKITRAMKMVAAAKLRRRQTAVVSARPYAKKLKELLADLSAAGGARGSEFMEVRNPRSAAVVIVTSDRGFCGAFNANLIRAALSHAAVLPGSGKGVGLMCIGRKGADYLGKRGYNVIRRFPGPAGDFTFGQAQAIAREIVEGYRKGDYDRVDVVYNEFKSIAQQRIVIEQFLPIPEEPESAGRPVPSDYIYEPGRREILLALLPRHLDFQIWRVLLESRAAEEAARMVAMESATENAREMIASLQLQYNKARQAAITKELLEVVAGAEALTGASRA